LDVVCCSVDGATAFAEPELETEGLMGTPTAAGCVGVLACGMFSGTGCSRPICVTPASEALPALERA
jgi:hypothetical protein